jgi:Protein of unknown function (DUF3662)/Inner membrane component of T3SS, cytoplasmic domain
LGILEGFERRLEGLVEGIFTKAFRTGLQPVELATRILREMDANKTVGVREVWVPNRYVFFLSEEDRDRFHQTEKALRRELETVVMEGAEERGWGLVGPPEVAFETDPSLRQGEFRCQATLVEATTTGGARAVGRGTSAPAVAPSSRAELVVVEKGKRARSFPLDRDRVVIGRLGGSDIVLTDPGASRRHAEVRRENGGFVISDLGSTNGTMVNGRAVGERTLEEGDRISIGRTVLEFRRR